MLTAIALEFTTDRALESFVSIFCTEDRSYYRPDEVTDVVKAAGAFLLDRVDDCETAWNVTNECEHGNEIRVRTWRDNEPCDYVCPRDRKPAKKPRAKK